MNYILIGIVIGACLYYFFKKGQKAEQSRTLDLSNVKTETLEGVLKLDDVVSLFKSQNLDPSKDTPFISKKLKGISVNPEGILEKPGYEALVVGVNYETSIRIIEIIYAKALDKKLEDSFADRDLIVLS